MNMFLHPRQRILFPERLGCMANARPHTGHRRTSLPSTTACVALGSRGLNLQMDTGIGFESGIRNDRLQSRQRIVFPSTAATTRNGRAQCGQARTSSEFVIRGPLCVLQRSPTVTTKDTIIEGLPPIGISSFGQRLLRCVSTRSRSMRNPSRVKQSIHLRRSWDNSRFAAHFVGQSC